MSKGYKMKSKTASSANCKVTCFKIVIPFAVIMSSSCFFVKTLFIFFVTSSSECRKVQQYRLVRQAEMYGPPGYTPGTPLGFSDFSSSSNTTGSDCPPNNPAQNKQNVISFYEELFGKKNFAAIETYIGPMYIQHNPMTLSGKDKLLETLNGPFWSRLTGYKIYRISAEDDLVWVHDRMDFGPKSYVFIDILRFECSKIVEHWDLITEITGKEINPIAFF